MITVEEATEGDEYLENHRPGEDDEARWRDYNKIFTLEIPHRIAKWKNSN